MGIEKWGKSSESVTENPHEAYRFDEETRAETEKLLGEARAINAGIEKLKEKKKELLLHAGTIGGGNVNDQINKEFYGVKEWQSCRDLSDFHRTDSILIRIE